MVAGNEMAKAIKKEFRSYKERVGEPCFPQAETNLLLQLICPNSIEEHYPESKKCLEYHYFEWY